jgi:hypothetical protein
MPAASQETNEATKLGSLIDALDALHKAQHLAELLYLAGEGLMRVDRDAGEAITTGVGALKDKLEEVDALLEELHERERGDAE